jgi:hypothetical protein
MPKKSMAAETAEVILEVLVCEIGLEPEQGVPDQLLKTKFLERGRHYDEIAAGLQYAATHQGWLRYDRGTDSLFLTESGFNWVKAG